MCTLRVAGSGTVVSCCCGCVAEDNDDDEEEDAVDDGNGKGDDDDDVEDDVSAPPMCDGSRAKSRWRIRFSKSLSLWDSVDDNGAVVAVVASKGTLLVDDRHHQVCVAHRSHPLGRQRQVAVSCWHALMHRCRLILLRLMTWTKMMKSPNSFSFDAMCCRHVEQWHEAVGIHWLAAVMMEDLKVVVEEEEEE
jgi:hypothetical protein